MDCGFKPKWILVAGNGANIYDEEISTTTFRQYYGSSVYTSALNGAGHAFTAVDNTGFNWDTSYIPSGQNVDVMVIG